MEIYGLTIKPNADLRGADLREADLSGSYLQNADLQNADLRGADLREADLWCVDFRGANLQGVDFYRANLQRANLEGVDLRGTELRGADLQGANIKGAQLPNFQLPQEVELIGWKKVCGNIVLRLLITGKRTAALTSDKCRADKVMVEAAFNTDGTPATGHTFRSIHDKYFTYTVGQEVSEPNYDPDPRVECTQGIHFFKTWREAKAWLWLQK